MSLMEHSSKLILKSEVDEKLHKKPTTRCIENSESLEKARKEIMELRRSRNGLLSKLRWKDREISMLHGKVSHLLRELTAIKTDHFKALEEIKISKFKINEAFRKNKMKEQRKSLYYEMRKEIMPSQKLLTKEKLKTKKLVAPKLNPHRYRAMQYKNPNYFETLQKKNHTQEVLMKNINLLQRKDALLEEKDKLIKELKNKLKQKPSSILKDPTEQIMEFYKTIHIQNEKIKSLTDQVNMFDSMLSDKCEKLSN